MVRSQLRRTVATLALTSTLSLIPLGSAQAAVRPRGEHRPATWTDVRGSWLRDLMIHLLGTIGVKIDMGVKIDPDGLTTSADPNGPQ